MKQTHFTVANLIYAVKCIIGMSVCYVLYAVYPKYPFNWSIVSVVLALSPDNSNKQAISRIRANFIGCAVGLCIYPLPLPTLALLLLGAASVIVIGFAFKITDTLRSALSAIVIVMLQAEKVKHWYIPFERMICVMLGCMVALLLTILFNLVPGKWKTDKAK